MLPKPLQSEPLQSEPSQAEPLQSGPSRPEPAKEDARLAALDRYDILDTPPEAAFDRITRMTKQIFGVPMATVTFIDGHRQWFKSKQGLSAAETCRKDAFCNLAIQLDEPLIVADTWTDERFSGNPFVEGTPHLRFYAGAQLRGPDGAAIGTLCAMDTQPRTFDAAQIALLDDLANTVMSELQLRLLAMRDSLTGALSRRAFREEAYRAVLLAVRHGYPLSCIVFDLDHFKAVNDENGHGVGDLVLKNCVGTCQSILRQSDSLGRIGGEEFALILPHANAAAAMRVAEKMRAAIAGLAIEGAGGPIRITASFGVAELDRAAPEVDDLMRRADSALYAAKEAGRNTCWEWQPQGASQANVMRRVLKAGQIAFNAGNSVIDCTVRGLCENGAWIDVISAAGVPDRFKLKIDSDGSSRFCTIVSKRDTRLEVAFC